MYKGPLGFRRPFGITPFSYKQKVRGQKALEEAVLEIIEEENIDVDDLSEDDVTTMIAELADKIYPEGGEVVLETPQITITEKKVFIRCMTSEWADLWSEGFVQSTTGVASPFEVMIMTANGCTGITESRALRVIT